MRRLILRTFQSPGDVVMLTAAVRDLHRANPGAFQTDVRTSADALWLHNPHLTRLAENDKGVELLDMHYPLIHESNQRPYHFLHGYTQYLEEQLRIRVPLSRFHGEVHLAAEEKALPPPGAELGLPERFWIIVAGGKYDFTAKWWNPASYQAVVDHFAGHVHFAQCGEAGHWHPPLKNVTNLVGKTSPRDFVRLMYHADGVICPVTFAMHLAAAVETKQGPRGTRPCVVIAGGREPPHWEAYPGHQYLHTVGALACCRLGGCWKSRCQLVGDGDEKDRTNVCEQPVEVAPNLRIPRCMQRITADDVIRRVELYLDNDSPPKPINGKPRNLVMTTATLSPPKAVDAAPTAPPVPPTAQGQTPILIRFRHGLGDAVQFTSVLRHLQRRRPDWSIDVAALVGKHSAFQGLCHKVIVLDREPMETGKYERVFDLEWPECASCYQDSPSTKAERCLREEFGIVPEPDLWRYVLWPSDEDRELARRYLERDLRVAPGNDGKYPILLVHYEGNTSAPEKNLPASTIRQLCEEALSAGHIPVILDWDRRSPLPDGQRIFNPHVDLELWRGRGTGDVGVIAALIEKAALFVGIDSGPLHVAAATTTPTIAIWTGHHPVHFICPADNVMHLVPESHERLLRGDRQAGKAFFEQHYRYDTYTTLSERLTAAARGLLCPSDGSLLYTRSFWIRANNADQDLVVVSDVAEQDSYQIDELPMPAPVVVDVGAHIGCFAARLHRRNPLARIVAVECCPENVRPLEKNAGGFATIIQAAVTYDQDVALLNAVFPNCITTGGSIVTSKSEIERQLAAGELAADFGNHDAKAYWADLRPLRTITLEEIVEEHKIDEIDVLKLDCEGSEFSILRHTTLLPRIKLIVGEYHGREKFHQLVAERFADWDLKILKDGELGTFWLRRPDQLSPVKQSAAPVLCPRAAARLATIPRFLVAAMRGASSGQYDLLTIEQGQIVSAFPVAGGQLRGFTRLGGLLWTIDSQGAIYQVELAGAGPRLKAVSQSRLAWEAHDLNVCGRRLLTASPPNNAAVLFDPASGQWSSVRPWFTPPVPDNANAPEEHDRFHINSVVHDGERYILSLMSSEPKPAGVRWRDTDLTKGLILRWGAEGFDSAPVAEGIYAPHSLQWHDGQIWWCDSFRGRIARSDGWTSAPLGGFARGLKIVGDTAYVGLSQSRVAGFPEWTKCGVCAVDLVRNEVRQCIELPAPYVEIYALIPLRA